MTKILFSIDDDVVIRFPHIHVAAVRVSGVATELIDNYLTSLASQIEGVSLHLQAFDPLTEHPTIKAWRTTYAALGVKPSRYRSSIESLLRRVQKGKKVKTGIPLVDLYNTISVLTEAPMGAYDVAKLPTTDLRLRLCNPVHDVFRPLGGSSDDFPLLSNVVVYGCGSEILCWGFNGRDSENVCIEPESSEVLFFSESVNPRQADHSRMAIEKLYDVLRLFHAQISEARYFHARNQSGEI